MTSRLPPSASVANSIGGVKLSAPAAERNVDALCALLRDHAPQKGRALELASGTGQHVVAFARSFPELRWHPTEMDVSRRASIDAYREECGLSNIEPAAQLDATLSGWSADHGVNALIILVNLLHLIGRKQARTVVTEAMSALAANGKFILYGPFKRDGSLISDGDARFHAQLSSADPAIGYKDDVEIIQWLRQAGAVDITTVEMPANNLAFVATR